MVSLLLQRVASLASELRTTIDSSEDGEGDESPLMKAKTPSELALLVKHYRLLQVRVQPVARTMCPEPSL